MGPAGVHNNAGMMSVWWGRLALAEWARYPVDGRALDRADACGEDGALWARCLLDGVDMAGMVKVEGST